MVSCEYFVTIVVWLFVYQINITFSQNERKRKKYFTESKRNRVRVAVIKVSPAMLKGVGQYIQKTE